jgi:hypothetical protein
MADTSRGGRRSDANGNQLMLADSHTAATNYGLTGRVFANAPKSKFLFWMKFLRPDNAGGSDWLRKVGFEVKNIDRPRVEFETQVLNQYNRKRIVQTNHTFEPLQVKFHDTMDPALRRMFIEYYQYYYGDSKIYGAGSSGATVYDIVTGEGFETGKWGFLPPLEDQNYGYFFSHISVYQFYNGYMERFDLINPKITSYNPDDFDYAAAAVTNEIQMSIAFEGIVYAEPEPITPQVVQEAGLDMGLFWDVEVETPLDFQPGMANGPNAITSDFGDVVGNVLQRNLMSGITGQGFGSVGGIISEVAGAYDANRGLAIGKTAANSLKNLVSGNTGAATQGVQGLLKGALFGKPGKLF